MLYYYIGIHFRVYIPTPVALHVAAITGAPKAGALMIANKVAIFSTRK